ncbi:calcium-dependent secretion activator 1-like [Anneissia japonica]|uniref:calcium-dependent secretion activator 1-like n=1 Tax=Anneissia japonica TaxID=1529436 RepID=UPI00142551BD|nr:calcium-dependent secretion activator 1-like [Anneissia japonica]
MVNELVTKLTQVLRNVLDKLSRYDEGTFFASILSFTNPGMELSDAYAEFICDNLEDITARTHDDQFLLSLYEVKTTFYKRKPS